MLPMRVRGERARSDVAASALPNIFNRGVAGGVGTGARFGVCRASVADALA